MPAKDCRLVNTIENHTTGNTAIAQLSDGFSSQSAVSGDERRDSCITISCITIATSISRQRSSERVGLPPTPPSTPAPIEAANPASSPDWIIVVAKAIIE